MKILIKAQKDEGRFQARDIEITEEIDKKHISFFIDDHYYMVSKAELLKAIKVFEES